jgi:hypothetical protein
MAFTGTIRQLFLQAASGSPGDGNRAWINNLRFP